MRSCVPKLSGAWLGMAWDVRPSSATPSRSVECLEDSEVSNENRHFSFVDLSLFDDDGTLQLSLRVCSKVTFAGFILPRKLVMELADSMKSNRL